MQCNIDAKGRAVRLISGLIWSVIGLVLLVLTLLRVIGPQLGYLIAAAMLVTGGFQIFEGWAGWCVLRALGMKTKI